MGFGIGGSLSGLTSGITDTISGAGSAASPTSFLSGFDLGGAGALLGGIGSIGGALGGLANPAISQHKYDTRHLSWLVEGAKRAGVHPLYALGQSTYPISGSGMGDALQALGQGVANAGAAATQYSADKRAQARLDADISESRSRALAARASAARDFALASESASRIKRAQQSANTSQDHLPTQFLPSDVVPGLKGGKVPTLPGPFGLEVPVPEGMTAEEAERHFGDIAQEIFGMIRFIEGLWRRGNEYAGDQPRRTPTVPPDAWGGP